MMEESKKTEESDQNFKYCEVCRRHHSQGRKHVYSRTHKENITAIINKYGKKVKMAKPFLKRPVVESGVNEENFWCYYCACEVKKHDTTSTATMKYGGFFRHLASQEHRQRTFSFWWEHRIEKSLKNSFLLTEEDYGKYKKKLVEAMATWEAGQERVMSEPQTPNSCDQSSLSHPHANLTETKNKTDSSEDQHQQVQRTDTQGPGIHTKAVIKQHSKSVYTIEAHGDNLTCIQPPKEFGTLGNIHTGATPPWLWKDNDNSTSGAQSSTSSKQIGPTFEDLQKQKRQKSLPKGRVGANFDRGSANGEEWLPSFGRVWQVGRRWKPWQQKPWQHKKKGRRKASAAQSQPDSFTEEPNG